MSLRREDSGECGIPVGTYHACVVDHLEVSLVLAFLVWAGLLEVRRFPRVVVIELGPEAGI